MSYLNRTNNYGRGTRIKVRRVNMSDRTTKCPWWIECPVCPINPGFTTHATHGRALTAALKHVEWHRRERLLIELKAKRT